MRRLWASLRDHFRPEAAKAGSNGEIRIVALLVSQQDRELLSRLAADHSWALHSPSTHDEAWNALKESQAAVVLCDREAPAADWRDFIRMIASSGRQVYTILVSKVADDYLWNEVVRSGGHDLLASPLRQEDVLRSIRFAWPYWRNPLREQPILLKGQP